MTINPHATSARTSAPAPRDRLALWITLAVALVLARYAAVLAAVWHDSTYLDTDDAMRMVQVRDWLNGQGWYDLTAHRMGLPPGSFAMHWSRIVDVPLGALIRLFGLVAAPSVAETLARILFPTALFSLLLIGLVHGARLLAGSAATLPTLFLAALGSIMNDQFSPGRIDHDDVQITLLCFAVVMLLASFEPKRGWLAAGTAAMLTLSLSISVEDLIFTAAISGCVGLSWAIRGTTGRTQAVAYAIGLLITAPVLYVGTVPPLHWFDPVCDAFAPAHLLALLAGALALLGLAVWSPAGWQLRLAALATAGGLVIGLIWRFYPACLGDPFTQIDPLVRDVWLNHVTEAQPLTSVIGGHALNILPYLVPPVLILAGASVAAIRTRDIARARWLVIALLTACGLAGSFVMIRVQSNLGVPLVMGGGALAAMLGQQMAQRPGSLLPLLASLVAVVPLSSATLGILVPDDPKPASDKASDIESTCIQQRDFRGLESLPPHLILTGIDAGPYLMVFTHHSAVAGPFHRNNAGNLASLRTFLAAPDAARDILRAANVQYLAFCPGLSEVDHLIARSPDGLAAWLKRGDIPDWLTPVPIDGPYQLFEIRAVKQ